MTQGCLCVADNQNKVNMFTGQSDKYVDTTSLSVTIKLIMNNNIEAYITVSMLRVCDYKLHRHTDVDRRSRPLASVAN